MLAQAVSAGVVAGLRLMGARTERRRVAEGELVVHVAGPEDGEPWVLLHGLGATGLSWRGPVWSLRRECRVVVVELSELGGSRIPGGALDVRRGAAAVIELVEREFPGRRVHLAGMSLGGWIAVRAALARPELFARLLLVVAAGYRHLDWEQVERLVSLHEPADVDDFYRTLFVRTPWLLRFARRFFLAVHRSAAVQGAVSTLDEADAFDDHDLGRLSMPVGLVWGEHDRLFPVTAARAMARALPHSDLTVLPGCAHALQWEAAAAFRQAVAGFRQRSAASELPPLLADPEPSHGS